MSIWFENGKGWRYRFQYQGKKYGKAWFPNKEDAEKSQKRHVFNLKNRPCACLLDPRHAQLRQKGGQPKPIQFFISEAGCWICTSHKGGEGYPQIQIKGKIIKISRWLLGLSEIIDKSHIAIHVCDNPACVNLDHLRHGTPALNMYDMICKGRHPIIKNPLGAPRSHLFRPPVCEATRLSKIPTKQAQLTGHSCHEMTGYAPFFVKPSHERFPCDLQTVQVNIPFSTGASQRWKTSNYSTAK